MQQNRVLLQEVHSIFVQVIVVEHDEEVFTAAPTPLCLRAVPGSSLAAFEVELSLVRLREDALKEAVKPRDEPGETTLADLLKESLHRTVTALVVIRLDRPAIK